MTQNHPQYFYKDAKHTQSDSYLLPVFNDILENGSGLKVLDLGCGNGGFCNFLCEKGYDVTGVDISESGIEMARKTYPHLKFVRSDICDLEDFREIEKGAFDVIVAMEVIEHLQYPRKLMKVVKKYLKQGGVFLVSTPYHGYIKNLVISLAGKWDKHFSVDWDVGHLRFFSVESLKRLVSSEGFSVVRFKFAGRLPLLWKSMICISNK